MDNLLGNLMGNLRSIITRRFWLFSGMLVLLLGLLGLTSLMLLPTSSAHAASPPQGCQQITTTQKAAAGQQRTDSQGHTIVVGKQVSGHGGAWGGIATHVVCKCAAVAAKGQQTTATCQGGAACTVKVVEGQAPVSSCKGVTCTTERKGQQTAVKCIANGKHP